MRDKQGLTRKVSIQAEEEEKKFQQVEEHDQRPGGLRDLMTLKELKID